MPKKALIIVDMLNDFVHEDGALYCGETAKGIIPFVRQRLNAFRESKDTVIYLQDCHDENDREFDKFPRHCVKGTWGSKIIDELKPLPQEIIIAKKRFNGFYGTDLEGVLASQHIEKAEVVGVCTSICIMDTVGGLANRNYKITVPVRGVADFDQKFHDFSLERMHRIYGADIS